MRSKIILTDELIDELNKQYHQSQPDIDILKNERRTSKTIEYLCKCHICNQTFYKSRQSIKRGSSCPICIGKVVIKGFNDIATTAPWMIDYLADKEDAFKYTRSSGKKIRFKCPICNFPKIMSPNMFCSNGYSCAFCSDGISRPNKFARGLFKQLPVQDLEFEYCDKWTNGKRYDVYFRWMGIKYLVEMDGEQHFKNSRSFYGGYEYNKKNDDYKNVLAKDNGCVLVRIPCKTNFSVEEIKQSFLDSELGSVIKNYEIDWEKCLKETYVNYMYLVCNYFESNGHPSVIQLVEIFHLSKQSISSYLKNGKTLGICTYTPGDVFRRPDRQQGYYSFDVFLRDMFLGTYDSIACCEKDLVKQGHLVNKSNISNCLIYRTKYKDYSFVYKNYSLLQQYEDNETMQKVCRYYNEHKDLLNKDIAEHFSLSRRIVGHYLRLGAMLGVCDYNPQMCFTKDSYRKKAIKASSISVSIDVYKGPDLIGNYLSVTRAVKALNKDYPSINIVGETICRHIIRNKEEQFFYKGFVFRLCHN